MLAQLPPQILAQSEEVFEEEAFEEEPVEDFVEDDFEEDPDEWTDPETIQGEQNPLNPAGESLDALIQMRINDDLWTTMQGELPCLEASEQCIRQLQDLAIANSTALQAIDQRVELVNQKIDEARANNQRTINLGMFEPAVQALFRIQEIPAVPEMRDAQGNLLQPGQPARRRGVLDRILGFVAEPLSSINDIFSYIGLPLFRNTMVGGDAAVQQRQIAIADLQVKIAEIENQRGQIAESLREQVILQVLDFDQIRREFQISQEVARRDALRLEVLTLDYRFAASGSMDTARYLNEVSALDQQKAQTFRAWAKLRSQLVRVKLLVLGNE